MDRHIQRLRKEIETNLNWGSVDDWHSSMFDELSQLIFKETSVMLSAATLKRFWGVVKHDGQPSITTLDALSDFVGRENWRSFKQNGQQRRPNFKGVTRKSLYVSFGFVLALVFIVNIGTKKPDLIIDSNEFEFSSRTVGTDYPNSVVFDFHIPDQIGTDSLIIQQYWDDSKTINITKDQTQATGIYYFPGYFNAQLLVEGKTAKAHDLFLKSNGWLGTIEYEPVPKYFNPKRSDSSLFFPQELYSEIQEAVEPIKTAYHFIDDLGSVSGDHFTFSAVIQNQFREKWAVCEKVEMYFIGTSGVMVIPFSKIGCSSDNFLMLTDNFLSGKENDLSSLNADFSEPVSIQIQVRQKSVDIYIDDVIAYTNNYSDTMGNLVGVRFKFTGIGDVLDYSLIDQTGEQVVL